jgi:hypothetical protein
MAGHAQQQPSKGLKPIGRIGLSDSDRGKGLPERKKSMYVETKKKDKPKTAGAGGSPPPKNPPKGPTGPKNPKDGKDYKKDKDDNKSLGGLTKGTRKEETKNPFKKGK